MINRENSNQSFFISLLSFIPIFTFVIYARIKNLFSSCSVAWQEPFYIGGMLAIVLTTLQVFAGIILDRLMLGANLFLVLSSFFFLFQINPCISILGAYKGPSFIAAVLLVGLLTTFFTPAGFIGSSSLHKKQIRFSSYILLGATVAAFIWSLVFNESGLLISAIFPFIMLRIFSEHLKKRVEGK